MADQRWIGDHGIGRFAREVIARLGETMPVLANRSPLHPLDPWLLRRSLNRIKPDLYFTPGFNAPRQCDTPIAITIHDLIHLDIPEESNACKRWYYRKIVRPAAQRARVVFTVSEFSKKRIIHHLGIDEKKILVVGNGVSDCFTSDGETAHHSDHAHHRHGRYLLYVGNHKPHKNVPAMIAAFAQAKLEKGMDLVMTGRPDEALVAQIKDVGLDGKVRFIAKLTDAELAGWYRGALALVCPSRYEGFGMPVLEAMACGTPVVCSKAEALTEVAGGAALQADADDTNAFAKAITQIVQDEAMRSELSAKGMQRANVFTWDAVAKNIINAIK